MATKTTYTTREGERIPRYSWSTVEFSEKLPIIWCHKRQRQDGEADGIPLTFASAAELQELLARIEGKEGA